MCNPVKAGVGGGLQEEEEEEEKIIDYSHREKLGKIFNTNKLCIGAGIFGPGLRAIAGGYRQTIVMTSSPSISRDG